MSFNQINEHHIAMQSWPMDVNATWECFDIEIENWWRQGKNISKSVNLFSFQMNIS
jgi:hypothetical protein